MDYERIEPAVFRERPNRFIAYVDLNGRQETVHVKNTGRCAELLVPGAAVYVQRCANPERKTKWDLIAVEKGSRMINMDSQIPNRVVQEWIEAGHFAEDVKLVRPETSYRNSRFDLYVEAGERKIFIEVKGVTLEKDGVCLFPDAPSERAVKHLEELMKAVKDGYEAYVFFVIQMKDVRYFTPNRATHPEFADALAKAAAAGVHVLACDCEVSPARISVRNPVEVVLGSPELKETAPYLVEWYRERHRDLPWRKQMSAYRVWISEIMLQQTRVEAVKPYYARFMELFPTVWELKEAPDDLLLKCWEGLGYYSRARNLKKAAAVIVNQYGGRLPASYEGLLSLPGIGSYTAGAIGSIAYGLPVPAVDGNVMRVLSRVTGSREDIGKQQTKRQMERLVTQVLEETKEERPRNSWDGDLEARSGSGWDGFPENPPGDFNQALIETGAVLCVPNGEPLCGGCPFRTVCAAKIEGLTGLLPVKSPKKKRKIEEKTVLLLEYQDKIAIRKRAEEGLLASLYEFPNESAALNKEELSRLFSGRAKRIEELCEAKHIFSHTEWHMKGYFLSLTDPEIGALLEAGEPVFFVEWKELKERYALPNAFQAYRRFLEGYFEGRDPKAAGKERHGGQ